MSDGIIHFFECFRLLAMLPWHFFPQIRIWPSLDGIFNAPPLYILMLHFRNQIFQKEGFIVMFENHFAIRTASGSNSSSHFLKSHAYVSIPFYKKITCTSKFEHFWAWFFFHFISIGGIERFIKIDSFQAMFSLIIFIIQVHLKNAPICLFVWILILWFDGSLFSVRRGSP